MSNISVDPESQIHLLAIRKALANRNAAVMVGAGFSRNAEGGENLATWSQLSEALAMELEPGRKSGDFTPAAASQLAEQYARVFSPTHLEQLIKRCVPDDQVSPGPLHTQLLELPWSDVFTTNYDTLLERAAERMFDVSYFTVCAREDIPQSKILGRRRIVKLHGSFPSHRPFILTEEEYRSYPERFAPFVNLVRQSLLENVFCLIGFSGDDPNFLHWLGWVRDMLDKHALPVYLFLSKAPTLGERKLYEARGVVPVILPTSASGVHDYRARYRALFNEFAKPLADSPLDWGNCAGHFESLRGKQSEEVFVQFMNQVSVLSAYCDTYPGWIVAPEKVRQRFRLTANWLTDALEEKWLRERLEQSPGAVILSVVDLYCRVQHLMLAPLFDDIAELGRQALAIGKSDVTVDLSAEHIKFLMSMRMQDAEMARSARTRVALSLLTWARQSHRTRAYEEIRKLLQPAGQEEATVNDRLVYEEVLRCLQCADRPMAIQNLLSWRPNGSNTYAQVLRGALMAEVDTVSGAIPILQQAIQTLRRQQRSRPGDPALISQEAWACMVASHLQNAKNFLSEFHAAALHDDADEQGKEREDFDGRLNTLGARGYSAREELKEFLTNLNAEAEPPTSEFKRLHGFDLGTFSNRRRMGTPSDLRDKITAAFAWLELIERTGLPSHTTNVSFHTDQMLQAAWWTRFSDRPERSIGLLLRADRRKALEARDKSDPPHRTGWLERHELAKMDSTAATELSQELMKQLLFEFEGAGITDRVEKRAAFRLEIFSRLVLRVKDPVLLRSWGQGLLKLHRSNTFQAESSLWKPASEALRRLLEVLPTEARRPLLIEIFRLPLTPTPLGNASMHVHELAEWVNVQRIQRHCKAQIKSDLGQQWSDISADLIRRLQAPHSGALSLQIWARLEVMRQLDLLTHNELREVGDILWRDIPDGGWPAIPGYYQIATLNWPVLRRNIASELLERFLAVSFRPFSHGNMQLMLSRVGRSYNLGDMFSSAGQIEYIISQQVPNLSQMSRFVRLIDEWLDVQLQGLVEDLHESDIFDAVAEIVGYVDSALRRCLEVLGKRKLTKVVQGLIRQIAQLDERFEALPFARINVQMMLIRQGERDISALNTSVQAVVLNLNSIEDSASDRAFEAASVLLKDEYPGFQSFASAVFNALVACVFAQSETSLSRAMSLLASLDRAIWIRYLDDRNLLLIDTALSNMEKTLAYERPLSTGSIPDESVPLLRYYLIRLAHVLVSKVGVDSDAARSWLANAENDPLPEIRLGRYKMS